jgi:hypothetical protein
LKAVSLWQPWASLIAVGAKTLETRSWPTSHRGKIVIHAAKIWNGECAAALERPEFQRALAPVYAPAQVLFSDVLGVLNDHLPFGCALAVADLLDCFRIGDAPVKWRDRLTTKEQAFGNYLPERWAWVFGEVRLLKVPTPMQGRQGVFECDLTKVAYAALAAGEKGDVNPSGRAGNSQWGWH